MDKHTCKRSMKCRMYGDCYAQYQWNKKMQRLLAKEPKSLAGFSFMPKGEVQ